MNEDVRLRLYRFLVGTWEGYPMSNDKLIRKLEDKLEIIANMTQDEKTPIIEIEESVLVIALENLYMGKSPDFVDGKHAISRIGGPRLGSYIQNEPEER